MREIIREKAFDAKIESIAENYERQDDIDNCIDWLLSRAEDFTLFATEIESGFYLWVMDEMIDSEIPQLKVLFKVEEDIITLIDVEEV